MSNTIHARRDTIQIAEKNSKHPRLILNDDGSNFLYSWDDLGAEDLHTYLSRWKNTHVDMVAYCVAFGGWLTYYDSVVGEPIGTGFGITEKVRAKRFLHNRERLKQEVGDYIEYVFSTLKDLGLRSLASFRMNDAHMSGDPTGMCAGRFWMNHREWCLGEPYGYYASCLDYTVPTVREMLRRLVLEVVEKYPDISGVELDGLRSPFFFKHGTARANAPIMTELIRQVRADLDEAVRVNGRERYLLWVNVPHSPELCLEVGMDVAAWDREGLVDGVSPGCYGTDFQPPVEEWKTQLHNTPIHPYINCGRVGSQYHSLEEYRGAAANAYAAGADGIYLFNFPCLDELASLLPRPVDQPPFPPPGFKSVNWHPDLVRARKALSEMGDPNALSGKDKKYLFYTEPPRYHHEVPEQAAIQRLGPEPIELRFRCYEDTSQAKEVTIEFKLVGVSVYDEFELCLNDQPIPKSGVNMLYAPGGRDLRVRPTPLEPYFLYRVDAKSGLVRGDNRLTVTLTERDADLTGNIEAREMELTVRY